MWSPSVVSCGISESTQEVKRWWRVSDKAQRSSQEEKALLMPPPFPPVTSDLKRLADVEIIEQPFKSTLKNHTCILQRSFLFSLHPHPLWFPVCLRSGCLCLKLLEERPNWNTRQLTLSQPSTVLLCPTNLTSRAPSYSIVVLFAGERGLRERRGKELESISQLRLFFHCGNLIDRPPL